MNSLVKIVLVGPTGAGKSQFWNFLHNDLSNSIYQVKASLNSCTSVPQSTIFERQNLKIELIDSPGSSDSNNNDEDNLRKLANFLRCKNEIHQIFLVLNFNNRLNKDTRDYLKILSWIFTPIQFIANLIVIFTHFPKDADEEDEEKLKTYKYEINEELNKIFDLSPEFRNKVPTIPVYRFDTKIYNKKTNPSFVSDSLKAANDLINEIKLRISEYLYHPIKTSNLECDKYSISQKIENEKKEWIQKIEELKNNKLENEKLKREIELEEKRHKEFLQRMESQNRSYLNRSDESEDNSFGKMFLTCVGIFVSAAASGCGIFWAD